jgi:hypothetical protein
MIRKLGTILMLLLVPVSLFAQGITTGAIGGRVASASGDPLPGATVTALHVPSGSKYGTSTRTNGRYVIPNIRVGGPYTVTVSLVGYKKASRENVTATVSQTSEVDFELAEQAIQTDELTITGQRLGSLDASKTGSSTNVDKMTFALLPTITGKFQDFVRLTPEARGSSYGGNSYLGQDSRYITPRSMVHILTIRSA